MIDKNEMQLNNCFFRQCCYCAPFGNGWKMRQKTFSCEYI